MPCEWGDTDFSTTWMKRNRIETLSKYIIDVGTCVEREAREGNDDF